MLFIGYLQGIKLEARLEGKVNYNMAYKWFLRIASLNNVGLVRKSDQQAQFVDKLRFVNEKEGNSEMWKTRRLFKSAKGRTPMAESLI